MPRTFKPALFLILVALVGFIPVTSSLAQDAPNVPEANPQDVASVDAIIAAVYDVISGGKGVDRDWDRFRSLLRPEARLIPSGRNPQTGQSVIYFWSPEEYIQTAGGQLKASGFFEREVHSVVERYGDIAHVFSTYESRFNADDPEPFQRGINSFQLRYDGTRWWVVNIFWQGENPSQPIPEEYLGG